MSRRTPGTGWQARAAAGPGRPIPIACVMGDIDLLRAVGLAGIPCVAVARADSATRFSRFATGWIARYDAWEEQEMQVEELLRFSRGQPLRPILYYGGDPELLVVSRFRDRLAEAFDFAIPDQELVDDLVDKARFRELSRRLELPVPASVHLRPEVERVADVDLRFPVMVKPLTRHQDRWVPVAGGAKALRVDDRAALEGLWRRLSASGLEVLAQEVVPGPETRVESYHAYVDRSGHVAGEFTGRKVRTLPLEYGHSTALTTTGLDDVLELGRDVVRRIGLRGLVKVDFKRAPDERLHVLEINPRYSLWHHLGAVAGVNLPAIVYADLAGIPRPAPARARPGVTWSQPWHDLPAARAAGTAPGEWLRWTWRCPARSALALDDPMPLLRGMVWRQVVRRVRGRDARRPVRGD